MAAGEKRPISYSVGVTTPTSLEVSVGKKTLAKFETYCFEMRDQNSNFPVFVQHGPFSHILSQYCYFLPGLAWVY